MKSWRTDWEGELGRWLEPFLEGLGHQARRRMCPLYVAGLIGRAIAKAWRPWPSGLRRVAMTGCTILLLLGFGTRLRWRQSFSSRLTGWSAAVMRCW